MRMVRYALPVAALVALAACGSEAADANTDKTVRTATPADEATTAVAEPTPTTLDAIPAKFRGYWDSSNDADLACTDLSDGVLFVEAKGMSFYEAVFEPETITQLSPEEISSKGVFNALGEETQESYRLKLSKNGEHLTLDGDGFDPFEYRKCGAELKQADLDLSPEEAQGD